MVLAGRVHRPARDRRPRTPGTALVTCLIATTLLAAGPILMRALTDAGLRATLASAPTTTRDLRVTATLDEQPVADLDATARRAIAGGPA